MLLRYFLTCAPLQLICFLASQKPKLLLVAEINIGQGRVALVDDTDIERVRPHNWFLTKNGKQCYAKARIDKRFVYLHRFIFGAETGQRLDHRNLDGLDCRRENLRLATNSQNLGNTRKISGTSSRFKGVSYSKQIRSWEAHIGKNGRHLFLGHFNDEETAARAYNEAARDHFGEFALLNDVPDGSTSRRSPSFKYGIPNLTRRSYRPWRLRVKRDGKRVHLGDYSSREAAHAAYLAYLAANDDPRRGLTLPTLAAAT